ncbi:putative mfs hexose transporter protein [Neofusicoccum parvum UCRNP2]|uniref:Putative mfs hexose transporter protein n=1 Tax=Botryosphaeria parva (strain UCR-NP2) TaxID=1287680 RepID=R1GTS2_BOTPV|nr:putative mfs hexose transporter protein [Neofusicoccum parvum UCRNP2]
MDSEKEETAAHIENVDSTDTDAEAGHLADQEDHHLSKREAIRHQPLAFAWCIFAVWTTLLVSFENQASGTVIGIPQFRKDFGNLYNGDYVIPANWQSAFSGAPVASTAVGALMAGQIADSIGRKRTIMLFLAVSYASITMEFVATTNQLFFGGKFLNGFAVGTLASVCPTYIGEISPLALRGLLTCLIALAYTVGPLTAALILNSTGTYDTRWAYRAVFCAQYGFAAVATVFVFFMPESPWWLVLKGKDDRALDSLGRLGYKDGPRRLALIKNTLEQIRQETNGVSYLECFRRSNLRRTIISIAPLSIQALSGVIFISGYSTYYAQLAGYSTAMSFKLFVALQVVSMVGNICSWFLIDRVGRRNLTLYGTAALTVVLLLTGGLATAATPSAITGAVALMIVYGFFYNATIGSTAYSLLTEVSTSRLRVKTVAIGVALQNSWYTMWSFVLPYLFNPDKANLGAKVSFIFGGFSVLCIVYLWFFQVETAGRSYAELDEMFVKRIPARKFKSYVVEHAD